MSQTSNFKYFNFEPIDFHQFYEALDPEYHFSINNRATEIYDAWLDEFLRRSGIFYHAQYVRHENFVLREFRLDHHMPEDTGPSECGLDDEWQEKYITSGLHNHFEDFHYRSENINEIRRNLQDEFSHLSIADEIHSALSRPLPMKAINELWFDTTISNPESLVNDLRQLSYEQYLKSSHWARVKSAMLLIHKAVCQEESHFNAGESWYFGDWESDIHVHHLNYTNLGNERYKDLILLCSEHHSLWHENMNKTGNPGINILDDVIF